MWLLIIFILIPIIEIAFLIQIGGVIGVIPTIFLILITAGLGAFIVRAQGLGILTRLQEDFQSGQDLTDTLTHGGLVFCAGALLLTPGFFTDVLGFSLLVPSVRTILTLQLQGYFSSSFSSRMDGLRGTKSEVAEREEEEDIIEADYQVFVPESAPDDYDEDYRNS